MKKNIDSSAKRFADNAQIGSLAKRAQPQCTQVETLSIGINANNKVCINSTITLQGVKATNVLAVLYDIPHGAKAIESAQRLLKCSNNEWKINMHDELVKALKDVLHDYWAQVDEDPNAGINDLNESLQRATAILKKAEQK